MHGFDEAALRAFGQLVVRFQHGQDITREQSFQAYRQIFRGEQPDLQQGALIAAHVCKGATPDELAGLADAHREEWQRWFPAVVEAPVPHLGLCGIGMDALKTPNVTSAAAVIAAACGLYVHKVGGPALTGISGSHDAFAAWGVDPNVSPAASVAATRQCRLGFTSVVGASLHGSGLLRVLGQIRIGTCMHIAGPADRHTGERHKIVGAPRPELARTEVELMARIGYERAMSMSGGAEGRPGAYMDELSNAGPTHVAELHPDGRIEEYVVTPADAGLKTVDFAAIAARPTREENARVAARALAGRDDGPLLDLFAFNAAACLRLMGKVGSLRDGVEMARAAVREGRALAQLESLIRAQNPDPAAGLSRLAALLEA
jgi:anthranilate phosphoribosyltransferase